MENQSLQLSKEYILDLMEQIQCALLDNDFEQIQNLSEMISNECNEFLN